MDSLRVMHTKLHGYNLNAYVLQSVQQPAAAFMQLNATQFARLEVMECIVIVSGYGVQAIPEGGMGCT